MPSTINMDTMKYVKTFLSSKDCNFTKRDLSDMYRTNI